MSLINERGSSLVWVIGFIFLSGVVGAITAKVNLRTAVTEKVTQRKTTDEIANTIVTDVNMDVAIGDNIYNISPNVELNEHVYPVKNSIEFGKDRITFTMNTKYKWVNYAVINNGMIVDYKIDPKTEIVGIPFSEFDSPTSAVTVKDYNYPSILELIPYTTEHSQNRLSFDVKDGRYKLKFPRTYTTSNDSGEKSEYTNFTVNLPKQYTDVIVFYSDLTHLPPTIINNDSYELEGQLQNIPHLRLSYKNHDKLITLSTNIVSIDNQSINGKLNYSGTSFEIDMYENTAYEISSEGNPLNYPTQDKFRYQIHQEAELSNWNCYSNTYNIEFKNCLPRTIDIILNDYYHTTTHTNTVTNKN